MSKAVMSERAIKRPRSRSPTPTAPNDKSIIELLRRMEQRMDCMDAEMLKLSRRLGPSPENDHGHLDRDLGYTCSNDNFSAEGFTEEHDVQEKVSQKNGTSTDVCDFWTTTAPRTALINDNVSSILGDKVEIKKDYGPPINQEVSDRWLQIIKAGLDEEQLEALLMKYPIADNSRIFKTPKLNPFIKQFVNASVLWRDEYFASRQAQISASLSAIGLVISELLDKGEEDCNKIIIERLNDAGRLLADLHHNLSCTRRDLASLNLNKDWKKTLSESQADEWLFGENLEERLRGVISIKGSSEELKANKNKLKKWNGPFNVPTTLGGAQNREKQEED